MKNETKRSLTSVLLAASLLFSSQSVIAFADYGSKLDASDLSPVQESVENATEEQQEDPSLSVEPVIGESTEAPVAAPMMTRADTPITYSAPSIDTSKYEPSVHNDSSLVDDAIIGVYQTKNISNYSEEPITLGDNSGSTFVQGLGYRIYTANTNIDGWVFKNWTTHIYRDPIGIGDAIDSSNLKGNMDTAWNSYAFSNEDDTTQAYTSGKTVRINHLLTHGESFIYPLYYTLSANYNPLVTVDVGENGKVTYNGTVVDKDTTDKKVEVEYGTAPDFTITPDTGYKVASVTADGIVIPVDENGKCTLPSVTEPTTLNVEFEKAEDEDTITKDKIYGAVIVTVACDNLPEHTHQYSLSVNGTDDGEYPNYKITKTSDESAILHLLKDGWLHTFVSQPGHEGHSLVDSSSNYINIKLTFDEAFGKWKLPENAKQYYVTIKVKCTSKIPEPSTPNVTDLDSLFLEGVTVKCSEKDNHTKSYHFKDIDADKYNNAFYTVTEPELQDGGKYLSVLTVKNQAYVDRYNVSTFPEEPHKLNDKNEQTFNLVWDGIKWSCEESTSIGISVTCGIPDPKPSDLAGVQVKLECVNDATHNQTIGFDWLSSEDYYTVTRDEKDSTKATVSISEQQSINWVNNSNTVGKPQHVLYMPSNEKATFTFTYTNGKWELDKNSTDSFHIKMFCGPTDKDLQDATVIVDCINANVNHQSFPFALISGTYEFGDVYSIENTYFCDVTVHSNQYVAAYNDKHYPNHNTSEDQAFILKFEDGTWKLQEKNITFKVSCDAPAKPTNPDIETKVDVTVHCLDNAAHHDITSDLKAGTYSVGEVVTSSDGQYICTITVNSNQYVADYNATYAKHSTVPSELVTMKYDGTNWNVVYGQSPAVFKVSCGTKPTDPTDPTDPGTNPGGNGGDNNDDDDRYTGGNTVTRTINDDDVPLNDRPNNTTTIDDEDVPLADLPDDTVTIDDGEVPLKANPSTGDSLPFAAMAAAALSLGGVIVLNRKKK